MFEFSWVHILLSRIISWLTLCLRHCQPANVWWGQSNRDQQLSGQGIVTRLPLVSAGSRWRSSGEASDQRGLGRRGDGGVTGRQALLAESPKPRARVLSMTDGHRLAGPQVSGDLRGCEAQPGLRRHIGRVKRDGKETRSVSELG